MAHPATSSSSTALIHPTNDPAGFDDHDDHDDHDGENASPFIRKTYQLVSEAPPGPSATVQWDDTGLFFIVRNQNDFTQNYLPRYFRHKNFASFVRQLNFYGFVKRSYQGKHIKFSHPQFQRNHPELLKEIKRKPTEQATYFKHSIEELQQKCNTLERQYGDLQQTMKHMIYVFARYVGSHQHTPTINDIHDRMQDLQGKMSISNQMPYTFEEPSPPPVTQHKRPRLMLEAGGKEAAARRNQAVVQASHNSMQSGDNATAPSNTNLEDDLWQQILSLTERMSNMPNGGPQQAAAASAKPSNTHRSAPTAKAAKPGRKATTNGMQTSTHHSGRSSTAVVEQLNSDEDNSLHDMEADMQPQPYDDMNLPMPSNIELIDDDDIASVATSGTSHSGNSHGAAGRKSPNRRRGGSSTQLHQRGTRQRGGGAYIEPASDSSASVPGTPTPLDDIATHSATAFSKPPTIPNTPSSMAYPQGPSQQYYTGNNGSYSALPSPQLTAYSPGNGQNDGFGSSYSPQHPGMDASFSPLHPSSFGDDAFSTQHNPAQSSNNSQTLLPPLPPINSLDDTFSFPDQQRQTSNSNYQYVHQ